MKLIGLTGRSGSGKGVVCQLFAELYDIPSIDCDKLSRSVCGIDMPCTKELASYFGGKIHESRMEWLCRRFVGKGSQRP